MEKCGSLPLSFRNSREQLSSRGKRENERRRGSGERRDKVGEIVAGGQLSLRLQVS